MEKETIIGELLTKARIYLDENDDMIIETFQESDDILEKCSKCNGNLIKIYSRFEKSEVEELEVEAAALVWNVSDLVVYRCENCKLVHSFWVLPSSYDDFLLTPAKEDEHLGGRILEPPKWTYIGNSRWGEGTPPKYPKKIADAYKKTVSQLDDFNIRLNNALHDKLKEMYNAGITSHIINLARNKVSLHFGHSSLTDKQLISILAAAIYITSNEQCLDTNKKISERQIEEIFGVTRKTIRKWRKILR